MGFFDLVKKAAWRSPVTATPMVFAFSPAAVVMGSAIIQVDTGLNKVKGFFVDYDTTATARKTWTTRVSATDAGVVQIRLRVLATGASAAPATIRWLAIGDF